MGGRTEVCSEDEDKDRQSKSQHFGSCCMQLLLKSSSTDLGRAAVLKWGMYCWGKSSKTGGKESGPWFLVGTCCVP